MISVLLTAYKKWRENETERNACISKTTDTTRGHYRAIQKLAPLILFSKLVLWSVYVQADELSPWLWEPTALSRSDFRLLLSQITRLRSTTMYTVQMEPNGPRRAAHERSLKQVTCGWCWWKFMLLQNLQNKLQSVAQQQMLFHVTRGTHARSKLTNSWELIEVCAAIAWPDTHTVSHCIRSMLWKEKKTQAYPLEKNKKNHQRSLFSGRKWS